MLRPSTASRLAVGACHGDLTGANASLAADGTLTFFDFEYCGLGFRAYDLATFRWGAAMGPHRLGTDDRALWSAFLAGYAERRPVLAPDLAAIPPLVAARHFWYLGLQMANWDYWGRVEVNDEFFDRELGFLRDWVAHHLNHRPLRSTRATTGGRENVSVFPPSSVALSATATGTRASPERSPCLRLGMWGLIALERGAEDDPAPAPLLDNSPQFFL